MNYFKENKNASDDESQREDAQPPKFYLVSNNISQTENRIYSSFERAKIFMTLRMWDYPDEEAWNIFEIEEGCEFDGAIAKTQETARKLF